ncbi:MAG TPA: (deoxy)nucleoside triphosphate pyrophosphohydrolase [bacterium]|nr:(deoxy)nucleoside triphosphate pyrophosphohydrolase [bacterium]
MNAQNVNKTAGLGPMEVIEVGCAIIEKQGKLLIAQRKPGSRLGGYWEFPGGKRKPSETMEECLIREVKEELGIGILPRLFLRRSHYRYPDRKVDLHFYLCDWGVGFPAKHGCHDFRWVWPRDLKDYRFPPADTDLIGELIRKEAVYFNRTSQKRFGLFQIPFREPFSALH